MRITFHTTANLRLSYIVCPNSSICDKQTLLWCKAHNCFTSFCFWCLHKGIEGNLKSSMVSKILTKGKLTICIKVGQNFNCAEEISILSCTCFKVFAIFCCPPVGHVSIFVIMTPLIIKSVCHLMSDNYTNSTIIECIVSFRIKERILKDTSRETNLVRRWIVISINCLWSHQPLVLINRFASFLLDGVLCPELLTILYILIIRLLWINRQFT